jgi:parallel beta-helix repeat protein
VATSRNTAIWICATITVAIAVLGGSGAALATTLAPSCDKVAAVGGSDHATGSLEHPFATVGHLAASLSAGQTGCVRGGVFNENVTIERGGSSTASLTISSYPGERATLVGRLWVHQGADYVTVENLNLNGRNSASLPSPTVNGDNDRFFGNDVTNEHTEICFVVGSSWGRANHTLIQGNRIHDCGMIPSRNQDHGIYVDEADNTQILDNVIYKNTDRGVQLYPDAQGTVVEHNIIDANGEGIIFSGSSGKASSDTVVRSNLITNAQTRYDVESWYPSGNPSGQNNVVQSNCVWGGAYGTIDTGQVGFQATGNTTANPGYVDPSQGDYRINSGSPCAQMLAGSTLPAVPFTAGATTAPEGGGEPVSSPGESTNGEEPPTETTPPPHEEPKPPSETTPPMPGEPSGEEAGSGQESGLGVASAPSDAGTEPTAPGREHADGSHRHGGRHGGHKGSVKTGVKRHVSPRAHLAHRRGSIARHGRRH